MEKPYILQIAICEDIPGDYALLQSHIENSGASFKSWGFESGEAFLRDFHAGRYDLIFMDIYMNGMSGIKAAEAVRRADQNVMIAFTTSSPDFTREGYLLKALKYLDKPVTAQDVKETLELALATQKSRPFITLTEAGGGQIRIHPDEILYFEHQDHVVNVHTASRVFTTSQSARLDDIETQLPSPPFLRCHRSYLVNLDYVRSAEKDIRAFIMKNGDRADIRSGGFKECTKALNKWRLHKTGRNAQ